MVSEGQSIRYLEIHMILEAQFEHMDGPQHELQVAVLTSTVLFSLSFCSILSADAVSVRTLVLFR